MDNKLDKFTVDEVTKLGTLYFKNDIVNKYDYIEDLYKEGYSNLDVIEELGVSRSTFYKWLRIDKDLHNIYLDNYCFRDISVERAGVL